MPFAYPAMLEVSGRRCVVVGTDAVRQGKVDALVAAGATDILVLALGPADRLDVLTGVPGITVERRTWSPEDLSGAFVVVASARDPQDASAIAGAARDHGALVNVMDDIPHCDFAAPAVVRRGELVIAIGTGGAAPALAKHLRKRLSEEFGDEWAEVVRLLREVREQTLAAFPDVATRARRWGESLDPGEATALAREGRGTELRDRLLARLLGRRELEARDEVTTR